MEMIFYLDLKLQFTSIPQFEDGFGKSDNRLIKPFENRLHGTSWAIQQQVSATWKRKGHDINYEKYLMRVQPIMLPLLIATLWMDTDWTQIPKALERHQNLHQLNAHNIAQYDFVRFGIFAARKAGLTPAECLNNLSCQDLWNGLTWKNKLSVNNCIPLQ